MERFQAFWGCSAYLTFDKIPSTTSFRPVHAIGAINLARLTGTTSILPCAFYHCCTLGGAVVDGWKREDGSVERLSDEDLKRCINGRDGLSRLIADEVAELLGDSPNDDCPVLSDCRRALSFSTYDICQIQDLGGARIFSTHDEVYRVMIGTGEWCDDCQDVIKDLVERQRDKMWNALPGLFDVKVDGWGT